MNFYDGAAANFFDGTLKLRRKKTNDVHDNDNNKSPRSSSISIKKWDEHVPDFPNRRS